MTWTPISGKFPSGPNVEPPADVEREYRYVRINVAGQSNAPFLQLQSKPAGDPDSSYEDVVGAAIPLSEVFTIDGSPLIAADGNAVRAALVNLNDTVAVGADTRRNFVLSQGTTPTVTVPEVPVTTTPTPPVQIAVLEPIASGSSATFTFANQPTAKNAIVVDLEYHGSPVASYNVATALTSAQRRVWLDVSDLSTLKQNTAGTTAVTALGQLVKRINNKGSLGGHLVNSTGWYLRSNGQDGYYLEANPGTKATSADSGSVFESSGFTWNDVIPATTGGEVNWCGRADEAYDPSGTDYWYSRNAWMLGDGNAGLSFTETTVARAYNDDGAVDSVSITHVDDADEIITWRRESGYLTGGIGADGTLLTPVASGNTGGTTSETFGLGGPWHMGGGSWPLFQGRFYGLVAGAVLSDSERAALKAWMGGQVVPTAPAGAVVVTDSSGRLTTWQIVKGAANDTVNVLRVIGATVGPKEGPSTDDFTVTVNLGRSGYSIRGVAYELGGLRGSAALDANAGASTTRDATNGTLVLSGGAAPTQAANDVLLFVAVKNADTAVNWVTSGWTVISQVTNATGCAYIVARKTILDGAQQSAEVNWDNGNAGQALGLLTVLRRGTNTDQLPAFPAAGGGEGAGGNEGGLTVEQILSDVTPQAILQHDYLPAVVPSGYDWYLGWRGNDSDGDGVKDDPPSPNPPSGFSAQVGWGEFFTHKDTPPSNHNWGIEIVRMVTLELRDGAWNETRSVSLASQMSGFRVTSYNPQTGGPIETRVSNAGRLQVKMPSGGGIYHFWEEPRSQINGTGATHRACVLVCGLIVWSAAQADDRLSNAAQRTIAHAGIDFWRTTSAPFLQDYSNNSDMGIGRGRVIGMIESPSVHTVTSFDYVDDEDAAISLRARLVQIGVLAS